MDIEDELRRVTIRLWDKYPTRTIADVLGTLAEEFEMLAQDEERKEDDE